MFKLDIEKAEEPEIKLPVFIERTDAEAETAMLWPPEVKSQLIGKDPDTEKD